MKPGCRSRAPSGSWSWLSAPLARRKARMKILIACDMEGISGVAHWDHVTPGHAEYARFRRLMTHDVNAAIRGAFEAGADEVIVTDGHWDNRNILVEELDPRARLNSGGATPPSRVGRGAGGWSAPARPRRRWSSAPRAAWRPSPCRPKLRRRKSRKRRRAEAAGCAGGRRPRRYAPNRRSRRRR